MALTLEQLTAAPSIAEWRALLIGALQGLGLVVHGGPGAGGVGQGTGSLTLSGTPTGTFNGVVKVVTSGEPGVAQYQLSTDGGNAFGATTTVPSSGSVAVGSTGARMTFTAGPAGAGTG